MLAESIVQWLVGADVIEATPTDCALGAESGYPPGPRYDLATTEPLPLLLELEFNGVEVSVGRRVFDPGQGDSDAATCPECDHTVLLEDPATGDLTDQWKLFSTTLKAWPEGGSGTVRCPHCDKPVDSNDWRWVNGPQWALGCLGFVFWNWPRLSDAFIAQLARSLGHRVVVTGGKL